MGCGPMLEDHGGFCVVDLTEVQVTPLHIPLLEEPALAILGPWIDLPHVTLSIRLIPCLHKYLGTYFGGFRCRRLRNIIPGCVPL